MRTDGSPIRVKVFLIHEMMTKHMIIDVAPMGLRTLDATLAITDSSDYPVVASHSSILDVEIGRKKSERGLSNSQIAAIRRNGGLIGIGISGGKTNEVATTSRIAHDSGHSTKSFGQSYLTTLNQVNGAPLAFGSDMNGIEAMPGHGLAATPARATW
jgi:microsomal dipeptidase-like Zn-dependent dipeptidase